MKINVLFFLLATGFCFSQGKYSTTQVSQIIRPDYETASHAIITKALALDSESGSWVIIYEHQINVKKYRNTREVKTKELNDAYDFSNNVLTGSTSPTKSPEPEEVEGPILGANPLNR
ncbi:hypothetical protein [Flavobacterium pallidum]|uniref:Uncharacterized protein n=1 Tax=Flavobacterium pallidum TaxID=2172098 RepID=A0A2S1SHE9_9FLAO|nr:hypothetical protein [Flavobacterium pallidum]AWI25805.1 hypothetical protein HYN49_07760 [Flavobacterium pallidum]